MKEDCIFCRIISGQIPPAKVGETKNALAFLDIAPANKGHTLVIPKMHAERFDQLDPAVCTEMAALAQQVARRMIVALKVQGYNILLNNGRASGQEVPHCHLHIIPRYANDGIRLHWLHKSYGQNELNETAHLLFLGKA